MIISTTRGGHKDSEGGGVEKYHDVYQIIGFNWV